MKAAHLKPVDRTPLRTSVPASHPWSKATNGGQPSREGEESGGSLVTDSPTNQQEFLRAWRGCPDDGTKRYGLLLALGAEELDQVFPVGSSVQLLGDILVALNEVCRACCSGLPSTSVCLLTCFIIRVSVVVGLFVNFPATFWAVCMLPQMAICKRLLFLCASGTLPI